jgi:hypothetical protein
MKILTIFLVTIAMAASAVAQAKPVAHKFDEFSREGYDTEETWFALRKERAERLEKRMRVERGKRMVVIGYRGRVQSDSDDEAEGLAKRFRWLIGFDVVSDENTVIIDGGVREHATIEIWIAPKGADIPEATPVFVRAETVDCPAVEISSGSYDSVADTLKFSVDQQTLKLGELNWTVLGGDIVEREPGEITVQSNKGAGSRAIAYLEIPAIPQPCPNRFSHAATFRYEPQLIDSFGRLSTGELRARLDIYLMELSNNPASQGVVHIYGSRTGGISQSTAFERLIKNHIGFRRFPAERITVVNAGYREEMRRDLFIVHPGAEMPTPEPTVDKRFTGTAAGR